MYARMRLCTVHDAVYVCVLVLFIINFASTSSSPTPYKCVYLAPAAARRRTGSAGAVPVV